MRKMNKKALLGLVIAILLLATISHASEFKATSETENSRYINKLTDYFPEEALAATIRNVDDYENIAVGTKAVMKNYLNGLDEFAPELKNRLKGATTSAISTSEVCDVETAHRIAVAVAEKIKTIGKVYDSIAAKYGEDVAKITVKGIRNNVIDPKNVDLPEKLARYVKGLGKDPFDSSLGSEQLLKVYPSNKIVTKIGSEIIDDVVILKKGFYDKAEDVGFGSEKIINKHTPDFVERLGISSQDEILDVVREMVESGIQVTSKEPQNMVLEKIITRGSRTAKVRTVINIADNTGSITTTFPFEKVI